MGDFVLVELRLEEGKNQGTGVCYVARVDAVLEEEKVDLNFLRMKSHISKDTFTFPTVEDKSTVSVDTIKGVLPIVPRTTARQAHLVKVKHPLLHFKML